SKTALVTKESLAPNKNEETPAFPSTPVLEKAHVAETKHEVVEKAESVVQTESPLPKEDGDATLPYQNMATESEDSGIKEPYIDIEKMLDSLSGDEESVRMLLEVFIQDHAEDSEKLKGLIAEGKDKEHAQRVAHSLKGVSGSIGAMPLHYISGDIESLIKQGEQVSDDKLDQLEDTLQKTTLFA
ncbi:Hpt domain-containing protein, partial [Vibrio owensii]